MYIVHPSCHHQPKLANFSTTYPHQQIPPFSPTWLWATMLPVQQQCRHPLLHQHLESHLHPFQYQHVVAHLPEEIWRCCVRVLQQVLLVFRRSIETLHLFLHQRPVECLLTNSNRQFELPGWFGFYDFNSTVFCCCCSWLVFILILWLWWCLCLVL